MRTRTTLVTVAVVAGCVALPVPAAAYVRTRTSADVATAWKAPCVTMEFSLGSPPPELDADGYFKAAKAAGESWSQAKLDQVNRCTNVIFSVVQNQDTAGPVGMDYHNRVIFRQNRWCRDPPPKDSSEPPCYDPSALAITSVFQLKNSGEILDADLEVNATDFTWGDYVSNPWPAPSLTHDFQGAVTHEFGHVIGLDHVCYTPGAIRADGTPVPRPVDNNGNPEPNCDAVDTPPSIAQATMYVSVGSSSAEVDLRSLSPDDVQAACEIYPLTTDFVCQPPSRVSTDGGGCSYAARSRHGSIACALALLAMALVLRRRR
ncbi:MAG TPA: hypothetical protein VJ801_18855 [Polyangia bacterium]|jgi:hypothetical protein|nr:hypothetical protein [Polyangia bacterium]